MDWFYDRHNSMVAWTSRMTENKSEIFSNSKTWIFGLAYAIVPIFLWLSYVFAITKAALTKTVKNEDSVNDSFFGRILQ